MTALQLRKRNELMRCRGLDVVHRRFVGSLRPNEPLPRDFDSELLDCLWWDYIGAKATHDDDRRND
jgi:hypothetical protein